MSRPYTRPVGPTRLADSSTSIPPPDPRSSTIWPACSSCSAVGLPHPRETATASSGSPAFSLSEYRFDVIASPPPHAVGPQQLVFPNERAMSPVFLLHCILNASLSHLSHSMYSHKRMRYNYAGRDIFVKAYIMSKAKGQMETMAGLFQALGDPTRLRILGLLLTGEVCVCHIHESLRIPQPKASRHLAYLRRAGLVETRREGLWVHYRLSGAADPVVGTIRQVVTHALGHVETVRRDANRLQKKTGCCLPASIETPAFECCGIAAQS